MHLAITEDHRAIGETVRSVLFRQGAMSRARAASNGLEHGHTSAWNDFVELEIIDIGFDNFCDGQGFGCVDLAVVLYEMGRVLTPDAYLPTVWAAAILRRSEMDDDGRRLLSEIAAGRVKAGVGLRDGLVLGGDEADVFLLADGDDMEIVERSDALVEVLDGLDRTRSLARVTSCSKRTRRIADAASFAQDVGRALAAAEAAGVASACLDLSVNYAKLREQFGRAIGSFQAVKHHISNMLVDVEMATAAAWDVARATDSAMNCDASSQQLQSAASAAGAYAFEAGVRVAKKNIQIHGGIGFTWENDAHLYLRRATVLRALFGGADSALSMMLSARSGIRQEMSLEIPPELENIRIDAALQRDRILALPREARRTELVNSGYFVPHWPQPWGLAAGPTEQLIIDEVFSDVERPEMNIGGWVTKTIAEYGTSDQLERYVRRSLLGEIVLCQMFSEPNAGSDAAAITTKGTRVEGGWLVNGQKVWISNAQRSDAGLATVRTDSAASKHYGVTMMLINLRASGVEIRPLRDITGDTPFNEVYFTNVFVSDEEVLGSVDEGWKIARATLRNERVTIGGRPSFSTPATDLVKDAPSDGSFDTELGFLIAESQVQQALKLRFVMLAIAGAQSGAEGNITKLVSGELAQRVADLAIRLTGPLGIASSETIAAHDYLATRCLTIAGGTSEVIRNQIAERTLGLPREPSISSLKSPD